MKSLHLGFKIPGLTESNVIKLTLDTPKSFDTKYRGIVSSCKQATIFDTEWSHTYWKT